MKLRETKGQGTVEAAVMVPLMMVLLMMLVQPGIILYDYIIMRSAAAETCRLLATYPEGNRVKSGTDFVRHRLGAVPSHDFFHVDNAEAGCSWRIEVKGGEETATSEVTIKNEVRPLPILGSLLASFGATNSRGNIAMKVHWKANNQPNWVLHSTGVRSHDWVRSW